MKHLLFVYEFDGNDEYFLGVRNDINMYVSLKHIGTNLDFNTVEKTLKAVFGPDYLFSASYVEINKAFRSFINRCSHFDENTKSHLGITKQLKDAKMFYPHLKSPEQKLRDKSMYGKLLEQSEARDERIREAREQNDANDYRFSCTTKAIMEAYAEAMGLL